MTRWRSIGIPVKSKSLHSAVAMVLPSYGPEYNWQQSSATAIGYSNWQHSKPLI
jgi:hypothetical protein